MEETKTNKGVALAYLKEIEDVKGTSPTIEKIKMGVIIPLKRNQVIFSSVFEGLEAGRVKLNTEISESDYEITLLPGLWAQHDTELNRYIDFNETEKRILSQALVDALEALAKYEGPQIVVENKVAVEKPVLELIWEYYNTLAKDEKELTKEEILQKVESRFGKHKEEIKEFLSEVK